jgi:hypothetical protein
VLKFLKALSKSQLSQRNIAARAVPCFQRNILLRKNGTLVLALVGLEQDTMNEKMKPSI